MHNNSEQSERAGSEPGGDSESDRGDNPFKILLLRGVHTTLWRETGHSAPFQPNPGIMNGEYQEFRTNSTLRNRELSSFA